MAPGRSVTDGKTTGGARLINHAPVGGSVAPDDKTARRDARARRQHPAERRMSFQSGTLLLVMMLQAAFGYALVGLTVVWVRTAHLWLGLGVLLLVVRLDITARRLPGSGPRESALRKMARTLSALTLLQLLLGLGFTVGDPLPLGDARLVHIGLGLGITFLVLAIHMTAIFPSIRLGAEKEWRRSHGLDDEP